MALVLVSPLAAEAVLSYLNGTILSHGKYSFDFRYIHCITAVFHERIRFILAIGFILLTFLGLIVATMNLGVTLEETLTMKVAQGIEIPIVVGNGQFGTARFQTETEKDMTYDTFTYSGNGKYENVENVGVIVDFFKEGSKEIIRFFSGAAHSIIIAVTRKGKTRRIFLPSMWLAMISGVNIVNGDCKDEINPFTRLFAKKLHYKEIRFNLDQVEFSMMYNYLNEIILFIKDGNISEAVEKTWDIVSMLVGEAKGEKIWSDGECAAIASIILIVALDAPDDCKNLANVYTFLAYMCEPDPETGDLPIYAYLEKLDYDHPARAVFQVAKIAPYRTRASFFTSALATLRLFTDQKIAYMTSNSEYSLRDIDDQKTIIYINVPDGKRTRYSLASLYINQVYEALIDISKRKGACDHRWEFYLDEFGNYPPIPDMGAKMSAAAGRGIFFRLIIQDYQQLQKTYKEEFKNIKANADLKFYLGTTDTDTNKEISDQMGTYTTEMKSAGTSASSNKNGRSVNSGVSYNSNLGSRPLLFGSELSKLKRPDLLVLNGDEHPAIMHMPDLSSYYANKEFGMGDETFNTKVLIKRREERERLVIAKAHIWNQWDVIKKEMMKARIEQELKKKLKEELKKEEGSKEKKKISFLDQ